MLRERSDCQFLFLTKRIERFIDCVPLDWGDGWENVIVGCTVENQRRADERLEIFSQLPIKHKEEVKQCGAKVVMKNNAAECVLISPDEYIRLMDEVNDARLLNIATERMGKYDPSSVVDADSLYKNLGITQGDLEAIGEVEFE